MGTHNAFAAGYVNAARAKIKKSPERIAAMKRRLLAIANSLGLVERMHASLAMFEREFDSASVEQVRQALTDAFVTSSHTRKVNGGFSEKEKKTLRRICAAAGVVPNKSLH